MTDTLTEICAELDQMLRRASAQTAVAITELRVAQSNTDAALAALREARVVLEGREHAQEAV